MYSAFMTRREAEELARRLQSEASSKGEVFAARESSNGDWEVVRVRLSGAPQRQALTETVEAKPSRPGDDPRSGHERRAPGIPGGLL
jgi:hypothetical protein